MAWQSPSSGSLLPVSGKAAPLAVGSGQRAAAAPDSYTRQPLHALCSKSFHLWKEQGGEGARASHPTLGAPGVKVSLKSLKGRDPQRTALGTFGQEGTASL